MAININVTRSDDDYDAQLLLGFKGDTGKSAYEYAVDGGYEGTETDFLNEMARLTTAADEAAQSAEDAEAALNEFVTVTATAETLPAGSDATATYADGELTFGIPKGDKGDQGDPYDDSAIVARMDSFTNLAEGSTTGDAELIDGRVGADGVTYTNIGGAIRGQVTDLKSNLRKTDDMQSATIWSLGLLNIANGTISESDKSIVSDWIRVSKGSTITTTNGYKRAYIVSSQPIDGGSYRLEYATKGTGSITINNEGYLRVCVFPPTETTVDISIRSNLEANIIQTITAENAHDIVNLNTEIYRVEDGLTEYQNGNLYFKKVLDSYVATNGTITTYSGWARTDFIPVSNLSTITIKKTTESVYNVWFDSNKAKVGSNFKTPIGTKTFEIPDGASYVILSDTTVGLNNTEISSVTKTEDGINKISKAVLVVAPYYSERYIGDIIEGDAMTRAGCFFRFDSITITNGKGSYTADWSQFLTDLSDSFGVSNPINAPVVASDYTANCARLGGTWSVIFNTDSQKFEIAQIIYPYSIGQVVIIGQDASYNVFGELYEQAKLSQKRGLACYQDDFIEAEEKVLDASYDFVFTFQTDCHYPHDDKSYNNPTNEIVSAIDNAIHVDALVNGGDSIMYGSKAKKYGIGGANKAFEMLDSDRIVYCIGNHDWNGVSGISDEQEPTWNLSNAETNTLYMRHNEDAVFPTDAPSDVKYFYRDFEKKKIRIIVLNTSDIDVSYTNDIIDIDPLGVLGIRQAQLTWLADVALDVPDDDWHIIIVMHGGLYLNADGFPGNTNVINKSSVINILSAFVNKTTYSYSETDITHDGYFTVSGSGSFADSHGVLIGVWSGHAHADGYCNKDGFNAIQTECSYLDYAQKPQRLVRTIDEVAVDCVSVNKTNRTITLVRFGYGDDRAYTY